MNELIYQSRIKLK